MPSPILSAIYIYPVKSMAGVLLEEAEVRPRGLRGDRRWMVVDEAGRFLTQRDHPKLAVVHAHLEGDALRLSASGKEPVTVRPHSEAGRVAVEVWDDTVQATSGSEAGDAWISAYLSMPCRLVYMDAESERPVDADYGAKGDQVSFADGFPVLLAAEASLDDLNRRLETPVPMSRFRPNLVISGTEAFEEDAWREIRIGEVTFQVVKPCARCMITTIDQANGHITGKEPLRTLAQYRRVNGKALFAQNLIPAGGGTVRAGDAVEVVR